MKRVAFTIILNGIKHLQHNNYYDFVSKNFDLWVIVEGVSLPGGSTSWCNTLDNSFHNNYLSNDGTTEFLDANARENVIVVRPNVNQAWVSKDDQVNAAINAIKEHCTECFLWQIDIDEQWNTDQLTQAEHDLVKLGGKTGCFLCNYFVGPNQQVFGDWGEGKTTPYRRLWRWQGEAFKSHEPPELIGKNGPGYLLIQRFNHYAYYFEIDVTFKEKYYRNYEGLTDRWREIQQNKGTVHVSKLLGPNIWWSNTNTVINYLNDN